MACSSSSTGNKGGEVDTGSALSSLRSPTGSFSKASGAGAFAGYRSKRAESSKVSTPASTPAGGGTSSTSSIRLLDKAATSQACSQGQACACPGGGSMSYGAESSSEGQLVRVKFDSCGFEDGLGFDGDAILLVSTKSLLGLDDETTAKAGPSAPSSSGGPSTGASGGLKEAQPAPSSATEAKAVLLAAKGTVTDGTSRMPLAFAIVTEAHYVFIAVSVPDGNIVIGVSDNGNAIVRSKEGTWRCTSGSRGLVCTSDQGESLDVAEDGIASEGSSASERPASPTDS